MVFFISSNGVQHIDIMSTTQWNEPSLKGKVSKSPRNSSGGGSFSSSKRSSNRRSDHCELSTATTEKHSLTKAQDVVPCPHPRSKNRILERSSTLAMR